jgi:hypothetical protein
VHRRRVDRERRSEQGAPEIVARQRHQGGGLRLVQQEAELGTEAGPRHGVDRAALDRLSGERVGVLVGFEPQPRGVAREPEQPRRVVAERVVVQHAERPGVEVLAGARSEDQLAVGEMQGDRVDREVAALQVLAQRRAELDVRQRARPLVALPAGAGDVEDRVRRLNRHGAEAIVHDRPPAQRLRHAPGDRHGIALDDEVELLRRAAQQHVAHGAADHVDGVLALDGSDGLRPAQTFACIHGAHLRGWLPS